MLSIIVAVANNNVIGKDNKLIWHLPEDLKRFKALTTGHTIIMGRKHIVLCNDVNLNIENENVEVLSDISMLEKYINSAEENFVIGGATIYKLLLPKASKLYITKINQNFEGDAFFPEINQEEWEIESKEIGIKDEKNPYDYEYINYVRK